MWLSISGALIGFGASVIPHVFKSMQDSSDKKQELEMMRLQIILEMAKMDNKTNAIIPEAQYDQMMAQIANAPALVPEPEKLTGNKFIDYLVATCNAGIVVLNSLVRPIVTYSFFMLYAVVKHAQFISGQNPMLIFDEDDMALFATVITFWFGNRMMDKFADKK